MTDGPGSHPPKAPPLGQASWCLYDWANSAFPTVITTFVFSAYFTKAIAVDEITGTSQWGIAISLSGLAVAVLSPFLGAVADHGGRRKPWIFAFTALCILSSALLWLARPEASFVILALTLAAAADLTTTVARRLERDVVRLCEAIPDFEGKDILAFVNRLNDYFFVLARYLEEGNHVTVDYSLLDRE